MKESVFVAKFFNNKDEELVIDGLIDCIEAAKRSTVESNFLWEVISIFDTDDKLVAKIDFKRDMFSNGYKFKMLEIN